MEPRSGLLSVQSDAPPIMKTDMTNLLPYKNMRSIQMEYWCRVGIVVGISFTIVLCIGIILLVPSYLSSKEHLRLVTEQEATIVAEISATDDAELQKLLDKIEDQMASVMSHRPTLFRGISDVLREIPRGIQITDFVMTTEKSREVRLYGIADRRDTLIRFRENLEASQKFADIVLPLSDLAASEDISFDIAMKFVTPSISP